MISSGFSGLTPLSLSLAHFKPGHPSSRLVLESGEAGYEPLAARLHVRGAQ